jgi:Ser/Thr protein kinase RdoA (MazF antagonist)
MVYGVSSAAACWALLPTEVRARFEAVAARMVEIMGLDGDVGLIHADLHLGNALFHRGGVRLIDFDDCGTGPRLYDLAVALWELRERPDYSVFRKALLTGYGALRNIDVTHLDDFIAVRQVAFDLWYTGIAQVNPAFAARLADVHRWSLSMLDLVESR